MQIYVEFTLEPDQYSKYISKETKKEWNRIKKSINEYKVPVRYPLHKDFVECTDDYYRMDVNSVEYLQVITFAEKYGEEVPLRIWDTFIEDMDIENAVAFVPVFRKNRAQINVDYLNFRECEYCMAKLEQTTEYSYMENTPYVHKCAYGVLELGMDEGRFMVTPSLCELLKKEGISECYFSPVYNTKKKILAYELVTKHVLIKGGFRDINWCKVGTCAKCGAIHYEWDYEEFKYQHKKIKEDVVSSLEAVNKTYEFYGNNRKLVFSKELYFLIKKYVPGAEFLPVYKEVD